MKTTHGHGEIIWFSNDATTSKNGTVGFENCHSMVFFKADFDLALSSTVDILLY